MPDPDRHAPAPSAPPGGGGRRAAGVGLPDVGGEMAARVRAFDWASTPLGDPSAWPQSLRTAVGICLGSRFPMFLWWGPQLINVYNDAYIPILGNRHPDALGRPARMLWAEVWAVVGPQAEAVMSRGEASWHERERLVLERNGVAEEAWFTWSHSPVFDERGAVGGVLCTVTEDTGRVLAEREHDRLAGQRQVALDAARLGWWHYDPVSKVAAWDGRCAEIFGVTGNRHPSDEIMNRVHPDDRPSVWAAVEAALDPRDPKPYSATYRVRRDDGSVRWVEAHGRATLEGDGAGRRPTSLVGTVEDVTDRRRAEAGHRFLVALDDAVRPLSDPGGITLAAATLLGRHLGADRCAYADVEDDQDTMNLAGNYLRGPGVRSIVGRLRFADFGAEVLRLMRAGEPYVAHDVETHEPPVGDKAAYRATQIRAVICVPLHKGGRFVAAMAVHSAAPRRWDAEEVELVRQVANRCWESIERAKVARSLGESLAAEKAARVEAERAGRMKDEFLATLSHELRTPLNAILGWSQLLRAGPADADDLEQGLATIERNARAQTQIIDDLLDMSRIVSGNLRLDVRHVDVAAVVREAIETIRHAADAKGVGVHVAFDAAAGGVSGDPARLRQVFWNLLSNAVKFTPRGGGVRVVLARADSHLEVAVSDTGEGIAPEFLPHVFDRFRQADASTTRRHGGLGLGLSIVKQLVELHGGSIRAESPGRGLGATFTVSLPPKPVHPGAGPAGGRHPGGADESAPRPDLCESLAGVRVLVVDDEADARSVLRRLLEACDAVVATAGSAGDALAALERDPPDVLVSDVGMPGEDGYSLIRRVRALDPERGGDVPAVALTAYARSEDHARSAAEGFQVHVAKPVEAAELVAVVAGLAKGTGPRGGRRLRGNGGDPA